MSGKKGKDVREHLRHLLVEGGRGRTVGSHTDLSGEEHQFGIGWHDGRMAVGRPRGVHGCRVEECDQVS